MNAAPYAQLIWKEYRAIRGFWVALIALAVLMELLVLATSQDREWAIKLVYNIALATPVFFAIGCIGTAYAIEKEDGTFDWLRASPVSNGQLLASKTGLCLIATAVMFAALWLITRGLLVAPPAAPGVVTSMTGLWLLAAFEALAWGLLFSLLSTRPLLAIILALFATSTSVHVLSWVIQPDTMHELQYARYVAAIPLRLIVLAIVAAADVYLGLRWLGSDERASRLSLGELEASSAHGPATPADVRKLLRRRDRMAILGRLTWQHCRQSGRLMLALGALQIAMCNIAIASILGDGSSLRLLPLAFMSVFAALMGASVFHSDQQRANFRFFVEHNVPPRYVWLSRIVPWAGVAFGSIVLSSLIWLGFQTLADLAWLDLRALQSVNQPWNTYSFDSLGHWRHWYLREIVLVVLASALTIPIFAAGQWVSMFVRSGLLASFFSLLLAILLVQWALLMYAVQLSLLYFVVPIPWILFAATWLRAPDWILENTTWRARVKAAGVVLVPTLLLLAAAPLARIHQVSDVAPGFSPASYVAGITPAALETGEIYHRANELYQPAGKTQHVAANPESLQLVLAASRRESCALANPTKITHWPQIPPGRLTSLTIASARELTRQGQLPQALDRYLEAFTVQRQLASFAPWIETDPVSRDSLLIMRELTHWAAAPEQTEEQIREAIARLHKLNTDVLQWSDTLKSNYILCERLLDGDESVVSILYPDKQSLREVSRILLHLRLLPWERARERRQLKLDTANALASLQHIRLLMAEGKSVGNMTYIDHVQPQGLFDGSLSLKMRNWGADALKSEASFETARRATLIILACQAYRLKHGELPADLARIANAGLLAQLPVDPMSGQPFVYLPTGIPHPHNAREKDLLDDPTRPGTMWFSMLWPPIAPETPCLWSPGFKLDTRVRSDASGTEVFYLHRRHIRDRSESYDERVPEYYAWLRGASFPIPNER